MKCLSRILSAASLALGPCLGIGAGRRSGHSAAATDPGARAQAGSAGRSGGGPGNSDHEECPRDLCQLRCRPSCSRTKDTLLQSNLNYQKDLDEVAVIVAQKLAGRENEIGEGMANVYANEFTEQELKDLVTFYKSPLGQKLLSTEPKAIQMSMGYMNQWAQAFADQVNGEFRAEMRKRGKQM